MKILIIDDSIESAASLKRYLEDMGYQVQIAWDEESARATLEKDKDFDFIFLDGNLSDQAGRLDTIDLAKFIKSVCCGKLVAYAGMEKNNKRLVQDGGCDVAFNKSGIGALSSRLEAVGIKDLNPLPTALAK